MKTVFISLVLFVSVLHQALAQKGQPSFGKIDKAELLMTECDFDKGADAVTLIDYGNSYYDRGTVGFSTFKTVFERRTRIKILKEKGMSHADVEIPFYTHNNEERILKLNANTYNLDETGKIKTTEVKKSSVYTKRIDANYSKMIIAFPEVKVGSIIEYSYSIERETIAIRDWFFQGRIPVRYSEYQLKIPQIFRFTVQPSVVDPIEDKQEVIDESISASEGFMETKSLKSNYIMHNLPGIKDEPYMGSPKDYLQRLEFQLSQIDYGEGHIVDLRVKWSDVIKDLLKYEDFGQQLQKDVSGARSLTDEAMRITDLEAKMKFIYYAVRNRMSWNEDADIFSDIGIVKAWDTKTGNLADINLLLIKLLNDVGIKAAPILFSTRDNGLVRPSYPFLSQFNAVMAYVAIKDKIFVLNGADKATRYQLIPENVVNTSGLILEGESGKWKDILSGKYKYRIMAAVQGDIDVTGKMTGNCLVNCYDYARVQRCRNWKENKEKFKDDNFIKPYTTCKIEDIVINNVDTDSLPLEQRIKFISNLNSSGDYRYFTVNLFSGLEKNEFIADKRMADVDFGVPQDYTIFGNFNIPLEYSFDGVPENITMTTPDQSIIFSRSTHVEDNLLNIKISVEFKQTFYPASFYAEFKEFYKKMFDKLNEQVVIKKKATP